MLVRCLIRAFHVIFCEGGPVQWRARQSCSAQLIIQLQCCPLLYIVCMLTCCLGSQHSLTSRPRSCSGQWWRHASAGQARWSPGPVQWGGLWVRVGGQACGGRHIQEEEGERDREGTCLAFKESSTSAFGWCFQWGRYLPRVVLQQCLQIACSRPVIAGQSRPMLCGAGFGQCTLHVSPESLQAIPGRTPCYCYPRLWEPWCCCPTRMHLWWLEGWWHTISLRASPIPFSFAVVI